MPSPKKGRGPKKPEPERQEAPRFITLPLSPPPATQNGDETETDQSMAEDSSAALSLVTVSLDSSSEGAGPLTSPPMHSPYFDTHTPVEHTRTGTLSVDEVYKCYLGIIR